MALGATVIAAVVAAPSAGNAATQGSILSPEATLHGYSLDQMARLMAPFQFGGHKPSELPKVPFQILYTTGNGVTSQIDHGYVQEFSKSFTVPKGTAFYVPNGSVDNGPPVIGDFPSNHRTAIDYWFGKSELGGRGWLIVVDGHVNTLDGRYLTGPVKVPTLPDGGTRELQMGAYLPALSPGKHTVQLFGEYDGVALQQAIQGAFLRDVVTYTVTVH
jgi:hypothetical protein